MLVKCGTEKSCPDCPFNAANMDAERCVKLGTVVSLVLNDHGPMAIDMHAYDALAGVLPRDEVTWGLADEVIQASRWAGDGHCEGKYVDDYKGEKRVIWQRYLNTGQM